MVTLSMKIDETENITFPLSVAGVEKVYVCPFVRNLITGLVSVLTINISFVTNDNESCNEPLE